VSAVASAIGHKRTAIRIAPFHVLQQTLDSDRIATFSAYASKLERMGLAYVHMVEPRYDQLSTEGAFSGNIKRETEDTTTAPATERTAPSSEYSLWIFRKILKTTPLMGAGGYTADSARQAVEEGLRLDSF
jgi:hypothetical protein